MAERKKNTKAKTQEDLEKEKQDEDEEEFDEDDEEFESEIINPGTSASFRYPFLRRMPTIRIQPIKAPIEVELEDLPSPKKEEDNADQYKPVNLEKNYSLGQKYELAGGGASYDKMAPKTISAPVSLSLDANFQEQTTRGFGPGASTSGYPGQESSGRKYDSGLEQQTKEQERGRRRSM